jgi:nitrogen regulation protein NR(I)
METVLIVDDEPNVLYALRKRLTAADREIVVTETAEEALKLVASKKPDLVLLDVRLPDMSGLDAFSRMRELDPRAVVIIMTAYSTTDTAIDAMRRGAYDYLIKPVDPRTLIGVVDQAIEVSRLIRRPAVFNDTTTSEPVDQIIGSSLAMQQVYKDVGRVAAHNLAIMVVGESGSGKELVARALFQHSDRRDKPFLPINSAALPEALLESELFGHERGAFTGADRQRIGKFEQADGGTLFLDEIGDMSHATQAKLLRVLQDGTFERVGGNETITADVRIIAATNRDLEEMVRTGEFRSDLYYRLNEFTIRVPPLRERRDDIRDLIAHGLRLAAQKLSRPIAQVSPEALELLENYSWPGNVRELFSVVQYACLQSPANVITLDNLPPKLQQEKFDSSSRLSACSEVVEMVRRNLEENPGDAYRAIQEDLDRLVVGEALRMAQDNQVEASDHLGISRNTLRSKMRQLNLDPLDKESAG